MQLVLLAVVVVWLALVWYTLADARRRLDDQMLVGSAVLASLIFPFLGTIVYMIVRPPEYLEDVRERELEMQAAEARLASLDYQLCPHCDAPAGRDFLRCPHCLRKLRDTCMACSQAARPRLDDLPVLRDGDPRRHAAAPQPAPARGAGGDEPAPDVEDVCQPPPAHDDVVEAAPAYEHVSQPPPSYDDIDRARREYEAAQATQAFSEVAGGDEPFGAAGAREPAYEDAPWTTRRAGSRRAADAGALTPSPAAPRYGPPRTHLRPPNPRTRRTPWTGP